MSAERKPVDVAALRRVAVSACLTQGAYFAPETDEEWDRVVEAVAAGFLDVNQKIVDEWNYMAKHGHCRPGLLGVGQTFDCWVADVCEGVIKEFQGAASHV